MTVEAARLIEIVYEWDRKAIVDKNIGRRCECWRILDALYGDLPQYRSPEYLSQVERILDGMRETDTTRRIKAELKIGVKRA